MDRHPKLSSPKWPLSSLKMVFVGHGPSSEIMFAEMGFVKSKNGLRQNYLRRNGLRQVYRWSSSTFFFAEMGFVKLKNRVRRKTTMLWLNILFLKYYTLMDLRL